MQSQHDHGQAQLREARSQVQDLRTLLQQTLQAAAYRGVPRASRDRAPAATLGHMAATSSSFTPRKTGTLSGATAVSDLHRRLANLGQGILDSQRATNAGAPPAASGAHAYEIFMPPPQSRLATQVVPPVAPALNGWVADTQQQPNPQQPLHAPALSTSQQQQQQQQQQAERQSELLQQHLQQQQFQQQQLQQQQQLYEQLQLQQQQAQQQHARQYQQQLAKQQQLQAGAAALASDGAPAGTGNVQQTESHTQPSTSAPVGLETRQPTQLLTLPSSSTQQSPSKSTSTPLSVVSSTAVQPPDVVPAPHEPPAASPVSPTRRDPQPVHIEFSTSVSANTAPPIQPKAGTGSGRLVVATEADTATAKTAVEAKPCAQPGSISGVESAIVTAAVPPASCETSGEAAVVQPKASGPSAPLEDSSATEDGSARGARVAGAIAPPSAAETRIPEPVPGLGLEVPPSPASVAVATTSAAAAGLAASMPPKRDWAAEMKKRQLEKEKDKEEARQRELAEIERIKAEEEARLRLQRIQEEQEAQEREDLRLQEERAQVVREREEAARREREEVEARQREAELRAERERQELETRAEDDQMKKYMAIVMAARAEKM